MEDRNYQNETTIKSCGIRRRPPWQQMNDREIIFFVPDLEIPNNMITTAKYSFITFIPVNLLEQFSKLANVYFLVIGIMQMIRAISITNGKPVIFGPLAIVISISMLKDFIEDYQRHRSDHEENTRKTSVLDSNGVIKEVEWRNIRVGDMVIVKANEQIPADLLLIKSSDKKGKCFIETKNLDGETNLKDKTIPKELFQAYKDYEDKELCKQRATVNYEKPNPYLYTFNGQIKQAQQIPLDNKNFILRGCILRNTDYIYGLCCYNGHDTKIMLNSVKAKPKRSKLELQMNWMIILIFFIQLIMCILAAFLNSQWQQENNIFMPYLEMTKHSIEQHFLKNMFVKWGNWILIFTNFVPISLIVTLEMVKYLQGFGMEKDYGTFSIENNIKMTVQSSNLNEELGQIHYIFSDKTGTLTKNQMDFKCLTVGGKSFGENRLMTDQEVGRRALVTNVDFRDPYFFQELEKSKDLQEFLLALALCHTALSQTKNGNIVYNVSSPDELALLNFAKYSGYTFLGIDEFNNISIQVGQNVLRYQQLHVLEFNSSRKRMSVIVKDQLGQITLYTKGADSVIEKRFQAKINPSVKEQTWTNLKNYSLIGLRTLIIAKRVIPQHEFNSWNAKYVQALSAIKDREKQTDQCQEEIERDLELIGGTAIEDKLQNDVGSTIYQLKKTGIQVWVLTGDKIETAINIATSCQLLKPNQNNIIVDGISEKEVYDSLNKGISNSQFQDNNSLVITGDALIHAIGIKYCHLIMKIADKCDAVVACRVSPEQKSDVVKLVRSSKPSAITLAIGDGANDVNMITTAHVGVGIKGVEGYQAARSADYAVGEFKILSRLTLYHGRECYRRNSRLVTYNFYKNMLLVLPQFFWGYYNGFSAINLYDPLMYQCYNLFYTSLPIVLYALFDEEFTGDYLEQNPKLYEIGFKSQLFGYKQFVFWVMNGAAQAFIEGYFIYLFLEYCQMTSNGFMGTIYTTGTVLLGYSVINSNWKIVMFSNTFTIAIVFVLLGSWFLYWITFLLISHYMPTADIYNSFSWYYGHPLFYLVTLIMYGSTTLIDMALTRWMKFGQYSKISEEQEMESQIKSGQISNQVSPKNQQPSHLRSTSNQQGGGQISPISRV